MDLWDHWPVLEANGDVAAIAGGALVIFLAAPVLADPEDRHAQARLWLFHRTPAGWRDLGPVFADGFSPAAANGPARRSSIARTATSRCISPPPACAANRRSRSASACSRPAPR
jgi:hypothetical protein